MRQRHLWLWLLVIAATLFAGVFWLGTLSQPLVDRGEFRQTQTALSALFMQPGIDRFLNYQTPVLGAPWSIPFELPLYQWLAHLLARNSGLNLSSSGRLISVLFGMACIWPAARLMTRFGLGFYGTGIFIILYCTSSIYLYWNRAFLIESTALFFTLSSLDLYTQIRISTSVSKQVNILLMAGFAVSLSLGLLVKATTALPAFVLMGCDWIWQSRAALQTRSGVGQQLLLGGAMAGAFVLLYGWTHHADVLKQLNPIGVHLTSSALRDWNLGKAEQRLGFQLWGDVVSKRMLTPVSVIPITGLLVAGFRISDKTSRAFLLVCMFLAISPLLIFPNLHVVHGYYQASNQIFLLMAVAASAATVLEQNIRKKAQRRMVIAVLAVLVVGNLLRFFSKDLSSASRSTSEKLQIGNLIQRNTPVNSAIVVFGDDWSSAFAYHSQRRAFARPEWAGPELSIERVLGDSKRYLGGIPLGAVVSKEPIREAALHKGCKVSHQHAINDWHLYLCSPTIAPLS